MSELTNKAARVLADRLREAMRVKGETQKSLANKSGVGQTTISLYLRPDDRGESATGKDKGATLPRVEQLAGALGMEPWELLMPEAVYQQFLTFRQLAAQIGNASASTPSGERSSPTRAAQDQGAQGQSSAVVVGKRRVA